MDTALIQTSTSQNGNAGNIIVDVASLSLTNGAQIVTSSAEQAKGLGGKLTVKAANSVSISGGSPGDPVSILSGNDRSSGLFSTASQSLDPANQGGGQINVSTAVLTMSDGAKISAFTPGAGPAGSISLNASTLSINGGAQILSSTTSSGAAGTVAITATNTITVSDAGSTVSTTTFGDGKGGDVTLSANQVNVQNGGRVTSESGGLLGGVVTVGTGASGLVTISAGDTVTVSGQNAVVSTGTFGEGDGGNVVLNAGNRVSIIDGGAVRADSGGILNGGVVSGTGLGGSITITAGTEIVLNNGQITTETLTADGGNITLLAQNLVQLQDSIISTSVQGGEGTGGNILIDPQFVLVNNSSIIANAFGGPGGNITIIANNFLASATSIIEASSALSTPGVIEIRSPENNVENSISQLPAAFIDASALLRGLCTARRTGAASSFVVAGRGGVPVEADGYLPAFSTDMAVATAGRRGEPPLAVALFLSSDLDCAR
jgi:large exoprotein involved in heme utilization and adhesion